MAQTPLQSPQGFAHCSKLQRSYCTKTHPTPHNKTPDRNWAKIKMALLFHYLRSKEKLTRLGEKKGKPNPAAVRKIHSGSAGCTAQTHLLWPGLHILPPRQRRGRVFECDFKMFGIEGKHPSPGYKPGKKQILQRVLPATN